MSELSVRAAEGRTMHNAYLEVADVLSMYFDGLYHSDTKRLRRVFHPRAQYVCATEGTLTYRTMEEYFPVVDERPSPASRGEPRADSIDSIEFAGPVTAFARVHCDRSEVLHRSADTHPHRRSLANHLEGLPLRHPRDLSILRHGFLRSGAPGRIRTHDLLIRSQTLYPAELRALGL